MGDIMDLNQAFLEYENEQYSKTKVIIDQEAKAWKALPMDERERIITSYESNYGIEEEDSELDDSEEDE